MSFKLNLYVCNVYTDKKDSIEFMNNSIYTNYYYI